MTKVSDTQFWKTLNHCGGLYAKTADMLARISGESYSRQAVKDRAEKKPEQLQDVHETHLDIAEETMSNLMKQKKDPRLSFHATKTILASKARHRGWGVKPPEGGAIEKHQAPLIDFGNVSMTKPGEQ